MRFETIFLPSRFFSIGSPRLLDREIVRKKSLFYQIAVLLFLFKFGFWILHRYQMLGCIINNFGFFINYIIDFYTARNLKNCNAGKT